jgi:hypothetical protein
MLNGFFDRRKRLYSLRGWRINGLSDHDRRRGIERLDDPVHGQVGQDDNDQCRDGSGQNVCEFHLFCRSKTNPPMQTNPIRAEALAILDAQIDMVYSAIKGTLDWNNLVPTVLAAARTLESIPGLTGPARLELLQKTLRHALKETDLPVVKKEEILHTIDTVVPILTQGIVLASKTPIAGVIQEVEAVLLTCCWKK